MYVGSKKAIVSKQRAVAFEVSVKTTRSVSPLNAAAGFLRVLVVTNKTTKRKQKWQAKHERCSQN